MCVSLKCLLNTRVPCLSFLYFPFPPSVPPHLSACQDYEDLRVELIRTERHLLKEMGFVCHVEHPHKFIFNYLQQLEVTDEAVKQDAWNLANDRWGVKNVYADCILCIHRH